MELLQFNFQVLSLTKPQKSFTVYFLIFNKASEKLDSQGVLKFTVGKHKIVFYPQWTNTHYKAKQ